MIIVPIAITIIIAIACQRRFGEGCMLEPLLWSAVPMWIMCVIVILSDCGYIF